MKNDGSNFFEKVSALWNKVYEKVTGAKSEERRRTCRLFLQSTFIPELIKGLKDGAVPYKELLNKKGWEIYLAKFFDNKFVFEWDEFQANGYDLGENLMLVTYKYPMPVVEHEHIYACIIINKESTNADCYCLEYSKPNEWVFGAVTRNGCIVHEPVTEPDMGEFVDWVIDQKEFLL